MKNCIQFNLRFIWYIQTICLPLRHVNVSLKNLCVMKAVIYARVSSTSDRQSTDRQVNDLSSYASLNGMELINTFEEHISGAAKNNDRPILSACIDYCLNNGIDVLLVSELSRLGRNVFEVQENVKVLKDAHVNIYFQKEQFSIFLPDGKENPFCAIFIAVLGTCAQMERENIKFRLNSGRAQYIAKGGKLGRPKQNEDDKKASLEKKEEKYKKVLIALRKGKSIRDVAKITDVSVSTVQRLKKEFNI